MACLAGEATKPFGVIGTVMVIAFIVYVAWHLFGGTAGG